MAAAHLSRAPSRSPGGGALSGEPPSEPPERPAKCQLGGPKRARDAHRGERRRGLAPAGASSARRGAKGLTQVGGGRWKAGRGSPLNTALGFSRALTPASAHSLARRCRIVPKRRGRSPGHGIHGRVRGLFSGPAGKRGARSGGGALSGTGTERRRLRISETVAELWLGVGWWRGDGFSFAKLAF